MSLAQYLALGQSIKNVSGTGRYKVATGPVAPRFAGGNRLPGVERRLGAVVVDTIFDRSQPPVSGVEERIEPETKTTVSLAAATEEVCAVKHAEPEVPVAPRGRWFLQPRGAEAAPAAPRQGELALGLVQPVRNDLRESDWEVVPAAAPGGGAAPARPSWWWRCWRWLSQRWTRRMNRRSH